MVVDTMKFSDTKTKAIHVQEVKQLLKTESKNRQETDC